MEGGCWEAEEVEEMGVVEKREGYKCNWVEGLIWVRCRQGIFRGGPEREGRGERGGSEARRGP